MIELIRYIPSLAAASRVLRARARYLPASNGTDADTLAHLAAELDALRQHLAGNDEVTPDRENPLPRSEP